MLGLNQLCGFGVGGEAGSLPWDAAATWNPTAGTEREASLVLSGGNLVVSNTGAAGYWRSLRATTGRSTGKYVFEVTVTNKGTNSGEWGVGISSTALSCAAPATLVLVGYSETTGAGYMSNGTKTRNGATPAYGATYTTGDVIGVVFDAAGGSITFYKNGVSQGVAYSTLFSGTYYPTFSGFDGVTEPVATANFGAAAFAYAYP
jgi:hypothetical protein